MCKTHNARISELVGGGEQAPAPPTAAAMPEPYAFTGSVPPAEPLAFAAGGLPPQPTALAPPHYTAPAPPPPVPASAVLVAADRRKPPKRVSGLEPEIPVNFGVLHMNTLKRYKKHYRLNEDTANKQELIDVRAWRAGWFTFLGRPHSPHSPHSLGGAQVVSNHFRQQEVSEMETIMLFTHMIGQNVNKDLP